MRLLFISHILFSLVSVKGSTSPENASKTLHSQPVRLQKDSPPIALDGKWDFEGSLEGWGTSATSKEVQANIYHYSETGEMRIQFLQELKNKEAYFDSPNMFIHTSARQAVVIRYRYVGDCRYGKIRFRGGAVIPTIVDHGLSKWETGNQSDVYFAEKYFSIRGDGNWRTSYAYLDSKVGSEFKPIFEGNLTQMRIWPATYTIPNQKELNESEFQINDRNTKSGQTFFIDWIRLVRGPIIEGITGCQGEKYFKSLSFNDPFLNVQKHSLKINNFLETYQTIWLRNFTEFRLSSVYNCLNEGGEYIRISGKNFGLGDTPAQIYIDSNPCTNVKHDFEKPQEVLWCKTPESSMQIPKSRRVRGMKSIVEIRNGRQPGLIDSVPLFEYALPPPKPQNVTISNVASRSVDLSWIGGGTFWEHMTYTGFKIYWKKVSSMNWEKSMVVGNITTTSIRPLQPNCKYVIAISGLSENQSLAPREMLDLYGRRSIIEGALEGSYEIISTHTLKDDFVFELFRANQTQNYSAINDSVTLGPTGVLGGEGHYGLELIGDASIENCNVSFSCCDDYDYETSSCKSSNKFICKWTAKNLVHGKAVVHNVFVTSNTTMTQKQNDEHRQKYSNFMLPCGPALRLTGSNSQLKGSAWYPRQVEVREGFDTSFKFRISNPSFRCNNMEGVHTRCRSRGADGFSFVVQVKDDKTNGYDGIRNNLAVKFDTYYNHEQHEPFENHISVQTRGWSGPNSADHNFSLGYTNTIPDLTDGEIDVRIKYVPRFDVDEITKESFTVTSHTMHFFENSDYPHGGMADWSIAGLGLLYIYVENLKDATLVIPLNLDATLKLNHGRAWVGFTASTGIDTFQVHDILQWKFSSLRMDIDHYPPLIVNGNGGHV